MLSEKSSKKIAAIATLLIFLSVVYISSCSKPGNNKYSCEGVVCMNGGHCNDSGRCVCPTGFEGANCSIVTVAKFLGTWDVTQVIIGSDSATHINRVSTFQAFLKNSATPTTFFYDNFNGDPYFNQVVCVIDSAVTSDSTLDNTNRFVIDTTSGSSMVYAFYMLKWGYGAISANQDTISGTFCVRHANTTLNWEMDTVSFVMTPHP